MDFDYLQALLGEQPQAETEGDQYQHIWVVAETLGDRLAPITLELLGGARQLADSLGVYVQAVLAGHGVSSLGEALIWGGADKVYVLDDAVLRPYQPDVWTAALGNLIAERRPEIVLLGTTEVGQDLAPRLAQRAGAGLIADCVELTIDVGERLLLGTRPLFDGQLLAVTACPDTRPQFATVRPGVLQPMFGGEGRMGDVETPLLPTVPEPAVGITGQAEASGGDVPVHRARVVVAGGRELGGPEGVALLEELAGLLRASVGADPAAVRLGWLPADKTISAVDGTALVADLYLAAGVDGDLEHRLAAQAARYVIAIHPDPEAPIFKWASLGVVGEPKAVLSALIEEIKAGR